MPRDACASEVPNTRIEMNDLALVGDESPMISRQKRPVFRDFVSSLLNCFDRLDCSRLEGRFNGGHPGLIDLANPNENLSA